MKSLFAVVAGCALVLAASGCANHCDDLQSDCDACANAGQKASCQTTVDADDGDACELAMDLNAYEGVACQ
jgi:hypothetical protein